MLKSIILLAILYFVKARIVRIAFVFLISSFISTILANEKCTKEKLLLELNSTNNDTLKAEILMKIALDQYFVSANEAIRYGNMAINNYIQIKDIRGIGRCNNIVGSAWFSLGEFSIAEKHFKTSNKYSTQTKDTTYIAKSLNNLGNVNQKLGKLEQSIDFYLQAILIFRATNNVLGEINVLNNIAALYQIIGNIEKAIYYLTEAKVIAKRIGNIDLLSTIYYNLTAIYIEQEDYKNALRACSISYKYREQIQFEYGIIKNLIAFGSIYSELGEIEKAHKYFNDALGLANSKGYIEDEAVTLMHLGYHNFNKNKLIKAKEQLTRGLSLADSIEALNLKVDFYNYLYKVDSTQGNFESALNYLLQHQKLQSTVNNYNPDAKIAELENKYTLTKQENIVQGKNLKKSRIFVALIAACLVIVVFLSITIIQLQNLKARRKISVLSQANLRSQINPHFIFNVLNSIHSYIQNNNKEASCKYLLKFAQLLRLTLDNSHTPLSSIKDELESLKLYLELECMRLNNTFDYSIIVDEEIDPYMFKIPPLLLQPYVENSILHGIQNSSKKGLIEIKLSYEDKQIHCSIVDNGIGRKKSLELKANKKNIRKSYGTTITENRLELLNSFYGKKMNMSYSDLSNDDKNTSGTKVEFDLPILT